MTALSGKDALAELDATLRRARDGLANAEQQYTRARDALAQRRREEIGIYAALAKLRLLAIESGSLLEALDDADRKVTRTLEERRSAAARLEDSIETANSKLGETEVGRGEQQRVVGAAAEALDAAEGAAQNALAADPEYQAQLKVTEQADFVADQAEDKAAAARRDRIEKGRPYEEDSLFSYLFARGYGTASYRAWPISRWLDGRVAKLCDYEAARRQYSLLIEIPERLQEHATHMRAAFDKEFERLGALETAAAATAGVPALRARLEEEEERLAGIDAQVAAQENSLRELVRERVQFANGNDVFYTQCIDVLSDAMRRQGLALLRERAARTREPDDDKLVQRLAELEEEAGRIEDELVDFARVHERESARLRDLEDVRRRFKNERYDDVRSEFLDAALFALVLERFVNGAVSSSQLWKSMRRQQRMRAVHADPRFGTGRFPRGPRPGTWRGPRGGGFGGGGFRGGGGFGGGGFKTGGGF